MVIAKNEMFVDPCHGIPVDVPLSLCDQFGFMNVCIRIHETKQGDCSSSSF